MAIESIVSISIKASYKFSGSGRAYVLCSPFRVIPSDQKLIRPERRNKLKKWKAVLTKGKDKVCGYQKMSFIENWLSLEDSEISFYEKNSDWKSEDVYLFEHKWYSHVCLAGLFRKDQLSN